MTALANKFTPGPRLIAGEQLNSYFDGTAMQPSTALSQAGLSSSPIKESGNLNVQVVAAGNGNAADTTDDVLFAYTLPANALDSAGRQVVINALGKTASNGNNKQIKIWWGCTAATVGSAISGGTLIATSGTVTTNAGGWQASAIITKYGAAGSNTQLGQGAVIAGATHTGVNVPVALTNAENAAIIIAVTGASGTTGAANDVLGQFFEVVFSN